ncbi:MAG TPA: hypothetical protein VEV17_17975 [Bryobacteraceae bacterium]|nr:hypothetical protein [Bryobacteraceae bacterium]
MIALWVGAARQSTISLEIMAPSVTDWLEGCAAWIGSTGSASASSPWRDSEVSGSESEGDGFEAAGTEQAGQSRTAGEHSRPHSGQIQYSIHNKFRLKALWDLSGTYPTFPTRGP